MRMLVTRALELNIQSEMLGQFLLRALDSMKLLVMCCKCATFSIIHAYSPPTQAWHSQRRIL